MMTAFETANVAEALEATVAEQSIMQIVDALSPSQLQAYAAFHPKSLRHYAEEQQKWIEDTTYFLGIDLGHQPTPGEIADKILRTDHSMRFRAYYSLQYPENVIINSEELKRYHSTRMRLLID